MMLGQKLNSDRIFKRLAKALIRLHICAGWSEPLLVAHATLQRLKWNSQVYVNLGFNLIEGLFVYKTVETIYPTFV